MHGPGSGCWALFFLLFDWFGLFQLWGVFFAGVEVEHCCECKVEDNGKHQCVAATLALITFCDVGHRKNFDWLIERSNKRLNAIASKNSFPRSENIC